ncbi:MAG: M20/M25/M40 family metallo-hydrolase [Clostridiales bacterium]|nr:M20/M25/M40 family metallo-hydrolase [Clostridiales bacterium]
MITVEEIKKKVDSCKDEALQLLVEALQSPSPTGSELPMALTVKRWLEKLGIQVDAYEYQKDRPNFIATWNGIKPGKTFLFNGHMDVFPATETDDPDYNAWSGKIDGDFVYGRGASDMKSGDCAALIAVKFLKEMGFDPNGSVVLNFVSDEESGGKYGILSLLKDGLIHADFGISMEPSSSAPGITDVMIGHGGVYPCQVIVYGDGGHAAKPIDPNDKDNKYGGEHAIQKAMKALAALDALAEEINSRSATDFGKSHMAVTKINAGIAVNNYPRRAEICLDRRYMPNESPESVDAEIIAALEKVKAEDPTFAYEFHNRYEPDTPVFINDENSDIVKALDWGCEQMCGRTPKHFTKVGGCDVAYIKKAIGGDYPWFGPGSFQIACADENVSILNYLNCIKVYMATMVKMLG